MRKLLSIAAAFAVLSAGDAWSQQNGTDLYEASSGFIGTRFFERTPKGTLALSRNSCDEGSIAGKRFYPLDDHSATFLKVERHCMRMVVNSYNKDLENRDVKEKPDYSYIAVQILGISDSKMDNKVYVQRVGSFYTKDQGGNKTNLFDDWSADSTAKTGIDIEKFDSYHDDYKNDEDRKDPSSTDPRRRQLERDLGSQSPKEAFHGIPKNGKEDRDDSWNYRTKFKTTIGLLNREVILGNSAMFGRRLDYRLIRFTENASKDPERELAVWFNVPNDVSAIVIRTHSPLDVGAYEHTFTIIVTEDPEKRAELTRILYSQPSLFRALIANLEGRG